MLSVQNPVQVSIAFDRLSDSVKVKLSVTPALDIAPFDFEKARQEYMAMKFGPQTAAPAYTPAEQLVLDYARYYS